MSCLPPAAGRPTARLHMLVVAAALVLGVAAGRPRALGAQAILNVERLQPENVRGWHSAVAGSIDLARGNTHHTNVGAGVAAGYRWPGDWLRVFAGIDYQDAAGEGPDNDRYLHVRYNHWLGDRLQDFHFVQAQASRSGILQRRYLVGSGLRWRIVSADATTFDVGSGVMYEREDLDAGRIRDDHPAHERVLRMANLLVLNQRLSGDVRLVGVAYVQPELTHFEDMRTLLDTSLLFAITDDVELAVRGQWRHDTRPPGGVDPDDVRFTTGFTVALR